MVLSILNCCVRERTPQSSFAPFPRIYLLDRLNFLVDFGCAQKRLCEHPGERSCNYKATGSSAMCSHSDNQLATQRSVVSLVVRVCRSRRSERIVDNPVRTSVLISFLIRGVDFLIISLFHIPDLSFSLFKEAWLSVLLQPGRYLGYAWQARRRTNCKTGMAKMGQNQPHFYI